MISDLVYTSSGLYLSNQVKSRLIGLLLGLSTTSLYTRNFYYPVNVLTLTDYSI